MSDQDTNDTIPEVRARMSAPANLDSKPLVFWLVDPCPFCGQKHSHMGTFEPGDKDEREALCERGRHYLVKFVD